LGGYQKPQFRVVEKKKKMRQKMQAKKMGNIQKKLEGQTMTECQANVNGKLLSPFLEVLSNRYGELEGISLWVVTFSFVSLFLGLLLILLTNKNFLDLLKHVIVGIMDGCKGVFNGMMDVCKGVFNGMMDVWKGAFNGMFDVGTNVRDGVVEVWKHSSVEKFFHLFFLGMILVFIPAIASAMYKVLTKDIPRWLEK
jgi:hypothetical protein